MSTCHSHMRLNQMRRRRPVTQLAGLRHMPGIPVSSDAGFTLLELLLAMTLLALVSLILVAGLRLGIASWSGADQAERSANQVAMVRARLRQVLARTEPRNWSRGKARDKLHFVGNTREVTFLTPDPQGTGSLLVASLRLQGAAHHKSLVLTAHDELAVKPEDHPIVTLPGVRRLALSYLGPGPTGGPPRWHSHWNGRTRLPLLIRLRLTMAPSSRTQWPTLVVIPRVQASAGCHFNVLSMTCKGN